MRRPRSSVSSSIERHSSRTLGLRMAAIWNGYRTSMRNNGSAGAIPKSRRVPWSAFRIADFGTSPAAHFDIAATIRRTMLRRKLRARTSTRSVPPSRATSTRSIVIGPGAGSDVNDSIRWIPTNGRPASRIADIGTSENRWYRYHLSKACRGWNESATSVAAHPQTFRTRSLKAPMAAPAESDVLKAITFPTALTPRSVRLALRKNASFGSRIIFADRRAAMHSPSTVRRSG